MKGRKPGKATVRDVPAILEIVNGYAKDHLMLPRSPLATYENLRDFSVAEQDGEILGCGALHVVWGDLAEIRSLAVRDKGKGYGGALARHLPVEAEDLEVPRVFTFTCVPGFFARLGFHGVQHSELPHKVLGDCLNCPTYSCCDEIAMLEELRPLGDAPKETGPLSPGIPGLFPRPAPGPPDVPDLPDLPDLPDEGGGGG